MSIKRKIFFIFLFGFTSIGMLVANPGGVVHRSTAPVWLLSDSASAGVANKGDRREMGAFLFQIGGGVPDISYGGGLDAVISQGTASYGISRRLFSFNLALGWYTGLDMYLLIGLSGVDDKLEDLDGNFIRLDTLLLGPGVKLYPFGSGLSLGGFLGLSRLFANMSILGAITSPVGLGGRVVAAYDLANRVSGFGLDVGVDFAYERIKDVTVTTASMFLDLVWK